MMRARLVVVVVTVGVCVLVLHAAHAHMGPGPAAVHVHRVAAVRVVAGPMPAAAPCTSCAPARGQAVAGRHRVRVHGFWLRSVLRVRRPFWRWRPLRRWRHPLRLLGL